MEAFYVTLSLLLQYPSRILPIALLRLQASSKFGGECSQARTQHPFPLKTVAGHCPKTEKNIIYLTGFLFSSVFFSHLNSCYLENQRWIFVNTLGSSDRLKFWWYHGNHMGQLATVPSGSKASLRVLKFPIFAKFMLLVFC